MQNVPEKFRAGQREAPIHVVSKNNDLIILLLRSFFLWIGGAIMHDTFCWLKADFNKVFERVLSDNGGNPVACINCFWRHDEERRTNGEKNWPV